jgi:hypothetical protein
MENFLVDYKSSTETARLNAGSGLIYSVFIPIQRDSLIAPANLRQVTIGSIYIFGGNPTSVTLNIHKSTYHIVTHNSVGFPLQVFIDSS